MPVEKKKKRSEVENSLDMKLRNGLCVIFGAKSMKWFDCLKRNLWNMFRSNMTAEADIVLHWMDVGSTDLASQKETNKQTRRLIETSLESKP